jgi:hypothetical protein
MAGRDDWATTAYRFDLGTGGDFLRVLIRIERGRVTRFTTQYEAVVEGRTRPAVRYDSAHGRPHRDILDRYGRVVEKRWLPGKTNDEALTEGIADIKAHWPAYREAFEGGQQ